MSKTNNKNSTTLQIEKDLAIEKEVKLIKSFLKEVDKKKVKGVSSLIDNAAFMAVTLRELKAKLNKEGLICEYQNGENQWGTKKSPEVDIYNTMIKNYIAAMKPLLDLTGKKIKIGDDGFEAFVNGKG